MKTNFLFSFSRYEGHAAFLNRVTEIVILFLMGVSAVFAYRALVKMDHNYHPHSLLDDLLLFICIPAFFVNAIFSIVPAIEYGNATSITIVIVQVRPHSTYKQPSYPVISCRRYWYKLPWLSTVWGGAATRRSWGGRNQEGKFWRSWSFAMWLCGSRRPSRSNRTMWRMNVTISMGKFCGRLLDICACLWWCSTGFIRQCALSIFGNTPTSRRVIK